MYAKADYSRLSQLPKMCSFHINPSHRAYGHYHTDAALSLLGTFSRYETSTGAGAAKTSGVKASTSSAAFCAVIAAKAIPARSS